MVLGSKDAFDKFCKTSGDRTAITLKPANKKKEKNYHRRGKLGLFST